jgi:hypothetical protein
MILNRGKVLLNRVGAYEVPGVDPGLFLLRLYVNDVSFGELIVQPLLILIERYNQETQSECQPADKITYKAYG